MTGLIFKSYAQFVREGLKSNKTTVIKKSKILELKLIQIQQKNLPKLRKAYYEFLKPIFWENDIYLDISGKRNTIIKFTGGYFAANKNIQTTQETIYKLLTLLRFKRTEYKWYKYASEYQYYDLDTPKDTDVVF